jgi:hypothetical protein
MQLMTAPKMLGTKSSATFGLCSYSHDVKAAGQFLTGIGEANEQLVPSTE